jgi:flagellar assembly factor FliW
MPSTADTTTIESSRFGTLQVAPEEVIEFPLGLIGLSSSRYTLLDHNPGSGILWLHSLDDPQLALPVVDPRLFFPSFELLVSEEDRERIGAPDPASGQLYVTMRAAPDPAGVMVNLRAPLVIHAGRGHQVLNTAPGADLQAPLFPAAAGSGSDAVDTA